MQIGRQTDRLTEEQTIAAAAAVVAAVAISPPLKV